MAPRTLLTFDVPVDTAVVAKVARNARSGSFHQRSSGTRTIRGDAAVLANARGPVSGPLPTPVDIHVEQRTCDRRRRDPDNVSGPAKAIVDGLVDAGRIPDDSWRHVAHVTYSVAPGCDDVDKGSHVYRVWVTTVDGEVAA